MQQDFYKLINNKLKFKIFLFQNLPSALFSGVRLTHASAEEAVVTIPYKWFSRNPFKSTYFACLAMAAEMSTGILALGNIYKRTPKVSMLVVKLEATYYKKATGKTIFTCKDGLLFQQSIESSIRTGDAVTVLATANGHNQEGDLIASFMITWSFKAKKL
jgi:acyl-coenzyme A thioesterase PaaI-like protein